jgi:cytochrome c556
MKVARMFPWLSFLCLCGCDAPAAPSGSGMSSSAPPAASQTGSAAAPGDEAAWLLAGSDDERFARVAKHLRGFDVAMAETGYRYSELYWAGKDRNWEYADYQLRKIQTAVANGVERRPRREASARMLEGAVTVVKDAIAKRDGAAFDTAFGTLTETCNACHQAEKMRFVRVAPPSVRTSVVVAPAEGSP